MLSLTVVRMLPVALSLAGTGFRPQSTAFVAWFGPRGLASLVFVVIVLQEADVEHLDLLVATMVTTIALSVYAHGFTSRPLTNAYARWFVAHPRPRAVESLPAHEHRWRRPLERSSSDDRADG